MSSHGVVTRWLQTERGDALASRVSALQAENSRLEHELAAEKSVLSICTVLSHTRNTDAEHHGYWGGVGAVHCGDMTH